MKCSIITLFPDMFQGPFSMSMLKKAQDKDLLEIELIDLREYGLGPRRQVDDTPYGGGDGMVLRPEPVVAAIESVKARDASAKVALLCPTGEIFKQETAQALSQESHLVLICGHYEGFDERIRSFVDIELSVGNFVLTGGEIPAMLVVDAITRLIPGVLGGERSALDESFSDGESLEHPHYTRPEVFRDMQVPDVLLSGHHGEIAKWRNDNTRKREN